MKKKSLTIGEISNILNIPASKLRFWEKKGLFHISKDSNRYRSYSTTDLIRIADVLFYRNMGIPVKEVSDFSSISLMEYGNSLQTIQHQLSEKIEEYNHVYQRACRQQQRYYKLLQLMIQPFALEEIPFSYVASWDFREKDKMLRYVEDPACYIWYKNTQQDDGGRGQKGIILSAEPQEGESPLLWSRTTHSKFITFPVKAIVEDDYQGLEASETITQIQRTHQTGIYMARHLLTCTENDLSIEYLQGYLEILDVD